MGMMVCGDGWDGYKYPSPCSSLLSIQQRTMQVSLRTQAGKEATSVTVYRTNFVTFSCVTLKLCSLNFVPPLQQIPAKTLVMSKEEIQAGLEFERRSSADHFLLVSSPSEPISKSFIHF